MVRRVGPRAHPCHFGHRRRGDAATLADVEAHLIDVEDARAGEMTLRYPTGGESHGKAVAVIVEGLPAGLDVRASDISAQLARRWLGVGRGPRQRFERDELDLLGGIRFGSTLGSPLVIEIPNPEWPKWEHDMSPMPGKTERSLTAPRPGHADLAGMQKYGFGDARNVLERASARETAARVAAGAGAIPWAASSR